MNRIVKIYVSLIVFVGASIGYFCNGIATSELAGVTDSSLLPTNTERGSNVRGVISGASSAGTTLNRTQQLVLKNRLRNRSVSPYAAVQPVSSASRYKRDDIDSLSLDAYVQWLNGEAQRLKSRWRGWTSHKRLEEAMRLVAASRPADSDTQDKIVAWRNFQAQLIRESTRPREWME